MKSKKKVQMPVRARTPLWFKISLGVVGVSLVAIPAFVIGFGLKKSNSSDSDNNQNETPEQFISELPKPIQTIITNISKAIETNKESVSDLADKLQQTLSDGIGHASPSNIESAVINFRDAIGSQKPVDLLSVFNVSSPSEIFKNVGLIQGQLASLSTWGDFKNLITTIESMINKNTTIKFGNMDKTVYQVFDHLKSLIDASKIPNNSTITETIMSMMVAGQDSQKIFETALGMLIYAGFDKVDKSNDQLFPLLKVVLGSFLSKVDWNSSMIQSFLPVALDLILHGTDYDMNAGVIYDENHPDDSRGLDKFINHIFEQSKITGFNIDAYRSEIQSGIDWLPSLFDGSASADGWWFNDTY